MSATQSAGPSVVRSNTLSFNVFTAGQTPGFPSTAVAVDLAPDNAGNMWFTDGGTPAIGRIDSSGNVTEYTSGLPPGAQPYSITAGPNGDMWFSDFRGVAIGQVTPQGAITEYDASQYTNSKAMGIAIGAHGEPWVVGFGSEPLLAHLTPAGTIVGRPLPKDMTPKGALTSNPHGNLWFVVQNRQTHGYLIERRAHAPGLTRTPLHMVSAFEPCCPNVAPKSIVIGPNRDPWFTTLDFAHKKSPASWLGTYKLGKVILHRITHKGLTEAAYASGIAADAHGLWMTGGDPFSDDGALWHVDNRGNQTAYNLPHNPLGLAVDTLGNPWFTAQFSGQPSRIVEVIR